jgi:hypothetical protein
VLVDLHGDSLHEALRQWHRSGDAADIAIQSNDNPKKTAKTLRILQLRTQQVVAYYLSDLMTGAWQQPFAAIRFSTVTPEFWGYANVMLSGEHRLRNFYTCNTTDEVTQTNHNDYYYCYCSPNTKLQLMLL